MKRDKIVLIDWNDTGVVHGWLSPDFKENTIAHCQSVGFCVGEDAVGISIAFAISDQGLIMEKKTIPKGCVISIKELRVR